MAKKNAGCMPGFGGGNNGSNQLNFIVPNGSIIVKEGELLKVGKKT